MASKVKIIIMREGFYKSIIADTYTFVMCLALVGIGVFLESFVMQLIGGVMFMVALVVRSSTFRRDVHSFDEARALIDEMESGK